MIRKRGGREQGGARGGFKLLPYGSKHRMLTRLQQYYIYIL